MDAQVRDVWPLLFVTELDRSLVFYRDTLGFELLGEARDDGRVCWCRLRRGGATLMLQQACPEDGEPGERGRGVVFYFICDDADAMHAELTARGLELAPATTAPYRMRQVELADPDGYQLCFESPLDPEAWG